VDFITSPAPNAGAIRKHEPENAGRIPAALAERAAKVLSLAVLQGCEVIVLGAWGCGVFHNDPATVAAAFGNLLGPGGPFHGRFHTVLFAVYDTSTDGETFRAFQRCIPCG
jgi:uncharacterized protein (TIGR02452 family)